MIIQIVRRCSQGLAGSSVDYGQTSLLVMESSRVWVGKYYGI